MQDTRGKLGNQELCIIDSFYFALILDQICYSSDQGTNIEMGLTGYFASL
jgi:hypothetical protein